MDNNELANKFNATDPKEYIKEPLKSDSDLTGLLYRIAWRSKKGDYSGHGSACMTKETCQAWADSANKQFPYLHHWVEAE